MKFYTWLDNAQDPRADQLKESARMYGINLEILGTSNNKWRNYDKVRILGKVLKSLPDDEVICVVDAFDVFFQAGQQDIQSKFEALNTDIAIGAERGYALQFDKYKEFYDQADIESPYKYVNSGTIVGKVGALKEMYRPYWYLDLVNFLVKRTSYYQWFKRLKYFKVWILSLIGLARMDPGRKERILHSVKPIEKICDQGLIGRFIARNKKYTVLLDRHTQLFWASSFEWEELDKHYHFDEDKIVNTNTGNSPAMIHITYAQYRSLFVDLFEASKHKNK